MGNHRFVIPWIVTAVACGGNELGISDSCNPLGGQGCMLPWPSMAYATHDSTSVTGYRTDIPIEAMPKNTDRISIDPKLFDRWDGFSPTGPMIAIFPTGVSNATLPPWSDPDASLAADSPIVLVDLDTGERAPFFAEVDQNIPSRTEVASCHASSECGPEVCDVAAATCVPTKRALLVRPLTRLHPHSHYAVAIRNTLKSPDGSDLPISAGFAALRDGSELDHPRFAAVKERATEMFAGLEAAGVTRNELVLAWDFVTASDEFLQQDLTVMRDAAIPALGVNGVNLTFTAQDQPPIAGLYKTYVGTFKSPNFLTDGENDRSILSRDAAGVPVMSGLRDANFAALIPDCVTTTPGPHTTIVFGHGLFGSAKQYLSDAFTQSLAEKNCFVIVAGDFIGFTSRQLPLVSLAVNDLDLGNAVTEKLAQSVIDFIALETIVRGPMATAPEFQYNGQPIIDPAHTYYVGGSLGGIMGNVFMAYDPNITRGVLAVPGGDWSMLVERSYPWQLLALAMMDSYTDPETYELEVAFFGMAFEPYDAITTAAHVIKDPLPGVPAKDILMWYSVGDCLVSNLTTELVAREMGIGLLAPAVKDVWGMTPMPGPLSSGINVFNDHPSPLPSIFNLPPTTDNGTHSGINRKPAALREVEAFLLGEQRAEQTCFATGTTTPVGCDCATGACD